MDFSRKRPAPCYPVYEDIKRVHAELEEPNPILEELREIRRLLQALLETVRGQITPPFPHTHDYFA